MMHASILPVMFYHKEKYVALTFVREPLSNVFFNPNNII